MEQMNEKQDTSAQGFLGEAIRCIGDRAAERDSESERSMLSAVLAFNALTGHDITESEGWVFMVCLKLSRSQRGSYKRDDYVDGAAYMALAGESIESR